MLNTRIHKWDVAIIGLGPVGATLANLLGSRGIKTVVLEKRSVANRLPRAVMFDDEVMRIFQTLGLSESMNRITEVGGGAKFMGAKGKVLVDWHRPRETSPNGWFVNYRFHQPELENVLRNGLRNYETVETFWNAEVITLHQGQKSVKISYREGTSAEIRSIDATYVVGCDGSRSFVRKYIESGIEDLGFHEPWLVVDLVMNHPDKCQAPDSIHFCEHERPSTYVYLGPRRKRWEFRLEPHDDPADITDPAFVWSLLKRWITPYEAKLERAAVYTFHSVIADTWHKGRLFIAGDAAHQTPPFMGQGMCAGIRDVTNLAWKLDCVIKGSLAESLLDTYQSERRPHVREFIELTIQMGELINRTRTEVIANSASLAASGPQILGQLKPILGPGLTAGCSEYRGELFPQPQLSTGEKLDDKIGPNFALVLNSGVDMQSAIDLTNTGKGAIKAIQDKSDGLKSWFDRAQVNAVLIRPDRYILGSARNTNELEILIKEATAMGLQLP